MTLKVLFFSTLREAADQQSAMTVDHADANWSVGELLEYLYERFPKLRAWDEQILVAVDHDYADRCTPLTDGQEVAVMPPVQGG